MTVEEMLLLKTGYFEFTPLLFLAVEETGNFIRSYCGLEEIPPVLNGLWADMALDYALEAEEDAEPSGFIASIAMGDTAYTFDNSQKSSSLLEDYRQRLNRYRRGLFL